MKPLDWGFLKELRRDILIRIRPNTSSDSPKGSWK
jgi:hypothetical protein